MSENMRFVPEEPGDWEAMSRFLDIKLVKKLTVLDCLAIQEVIERVTILEPLDFDIPPDLR
jgi:hypothetical protein